MQLFNTAIELQHYLSQPSAAGKTIGLVPTMGALHAGHLSLIAKARQTTDIVIVSIFVNPLQFGPHEDFDQYPRPQQADRDLCQTAGVDALFMPSAIEVYGTPKPDASAIAQVLPPTSMTEVLCGRSRPTHFQSVATIVTKLLNIVRPTHTFFGQKDAQQVAILKRVAQDLYLPGQIIVCPIIREPDGLALSSRNRYLSEKSRQKATVLARSLQAAEAAFAQGERSAAVLVQTAKAVLSTEPTVTLDYLALVHPDTLKPLQTVDPQGMMAIAANITNSETADQTQTRLIDNVVLQVSEPASSSSRQPIIAIDGPAGAGKSTVARQVAHKLGLLYLDTGAMYRALTWFVLQQGIDPTSAAKVEQQLANCNIKLIANSVGDTPLPPTVQVNGQDVTAAIRTETVTQQVSTIAAQAAVRSHLVAQQQAYGTASGGVVADGRDIGTHVFPEAELKIYLTASVHERAARRYRDLKAADKIADSATDLPTLDELAHSISERDRQDSTRTVSPLQKAADAIEINTDHLTASQVIQKISSLYHQIAP